MNPVIRYLNWNCCKFKFYLKSKNAGDTYVASALAFNIDESK
jgi:hypothetical protein